MTAGRRPVALRRGRSELGPARHGEAGETLLETVISVLLIATVVMAVILSLFTVMRTTRSNRQVVRSGNETVTVAEQIRQLPYQPCGGAGSPLTNYQDLVLFSVPGYEATITGVRFLKDRDSTTPPAGDSFQAACPAEDQGLQELSVRLRARANPDNQQTLTFYRRADTCPEQNRKYEGQQC